MAIKKPTIQESGVRDDGYHHTIELHGKQSSRHHQTFAKTRPEQHQRLGRTCHGLGRIGDPNTHSSRG